MAKQLIEELRKGTLSGNPQAAKELLVGREFWMEGIRGDLDDAREYGTSPVRFVVGSYGDGKSHFLQAVLGEALERDFWCSYCSLERDVALKKLEVEVLWKHLTRRLYIPGQGETVDLAGALEHVAEERGWREDSKEAEDTVRSARIEPDLERGILGYLERWRTQKDTSEYRYWLLGERAKPGGVSRRIDGTNVLDMLMSLVRLLRHLGYSGIVVALDEMELAIDNSAAVRRRFYESIRQLIDRRVPGYVVYGAATPDVLSDPKGFREHQPLWDRIRVYDEKSAREAPSPRQVIVYLERSPLAEDDFVEIGRRIRQLHAEAEQWNAEADYSDEVLHAVAKNVMGLRVEVGKPRVFVRNVVDDLDRKLADPQFDPWENLRERTWKAAEQVAESERKRHG